MKDQHKDNIPKQKQRIIQTVRYFKNAYKKHWKVIRKK